jgi:predicted CoA-substrate-specific enzyme activase
MRELESPDFPPVRDDAVIALPDLQSFGQRDSYNKHTLAPAFARDTGYYLGIDIGSTSTNIVLINEDCEIMDYQYIRTAGDPVGAVEKAFENIRNKYGTGIHIAGACTTGSGRYMIGELIGADLIKDEITAQAKAAVRINPRVDTVFEIGGQDSKFIQIKNGAVTDFQMNKICAAGTGSFIEEQAAKFNIPIESFADIALQSRSPIYLGERCTVFIETSIAEHLSRGAGIEDIAAGLCYSVARNYFDRVVGQKKPGTTIFFQGGVAYNQGVVNAFRAITGKKIIVPPFFSVTGAYGAAILAKEERMSGKSAFKGFIINLPEKKKAPPVPAPDDTGSFNREVNRIIFQDYDSTCDKSKKTVGIPRALFTFGMFPMFNAFFKELASMCCSPIRQANRQSGGARSTRLTRPVTRSN